VRLYLLNALKRRAKNCSATFASCPCTFHRHCSVLFDPDREGGTTLPIDACKKYSTVLFRLKSKETFQSSNIQQTISMPLFLTEKINTFRLCGKKCFSSVGARSRTAAIPPRAISGSMLRLWWHLFVCSAHRVTVFRRKLDYVSSSSNLCFSSTSTPLHRSVSTSSGIYNISNGTPLSNGNSKFLHGKRSFSPVFGSRHLIFCDVCFCSFLFFFLLRIIGLVSLTNVGTPHPAARCWCLFSLLTWDVKATLFMVGTSVWRAITRNANTAQIATKIHLKQLKVG